MRVPGILAVLMLAACSTVPPRDETPAATTAAVRNESAAPMEAAVPLPQTATDAAATAAPSPAPAPAAPAVTDAAPRRDTAATPEATPESVPRTAPAPAPEPAPAAVPGDAVLAGHIELVQAHEVAAGPALLSRTWVAFRPRTPVAVEAGEELRILTRRSQFQPQAMAVTVGTTVRFPNLDRILHNVFSLSEGNSFDVGLYGPGGGEAHTFTRPGFADIYCNVHPNMAAFLWVLDTPHFAQVNADGSFRLDGVPAVGGALEVWNHRADPVSVPAVAPDEALRVTLRITRPPVPQHTNKLGEAY